MIEGEMEASRLARRESGEASRRYRDGRYRTIESWSCERWVVGKAEWLPGKRGYNPRFVVTDIPKDRIGARALYEDLYCARGDMENRIKGQELDLFADRTSAHTMRANQLRAYLSAFAGVVIQIIRTFGLKATRLARAQAGTIRTRLLKIAGSVRMTTRKIWISLSSVYPWRELFKRVARNLEQPLSSYTQHPRNASEPCPPCASDGFTPGRWLGVRCTPGSRTVHGYIAPLSTQVAASHPRRGPTAP